MQGPELPCDDPPEVTLGKIAEGRLKHRPPIADVYGTTPKDFKPLNKPSPEALRRIRVILSLQANDHHKFPRCRYKDHKKASILDEALGFTLEQRDHRSKEGYHTKDGHICAECRCQHIAGAGTRGWWYWAPEDGPEHGHYGVGPCFRHSPYYSTRFIDRQRANYTDMIRTEIKTMQEYGRYQDRQGNYMVDVKHAGEIARARTDTKTSLNALKRLADETITKLREHRNNPDAQSDMIEGMCEVFGFPPDMLDQKDREKLVLLASMKGMTETAHGKHIPMSDKTAIMLEKDLIKAVGDSAFQSFKSHEEDFMKREVVSKMIERFYAEAETLFRPLGGEETWGRFREAMRDVARELTEMDMGGKHEPRKPLRANVTLDGKPEPIAKAPHQRSEEDEAEYFEPEEA